MHPKVQPIRIRDIEKLDCELRNFSENTQRTYLHSIRQIEADRLIIRKLIERKYLLKEKVWKYVQIRRSLDNPVEVASLGEKIDEATVRLQEAEMDIEKAFAGIEYLCVDVER